MFNKGFLKILIKDLLLLLVFVLIVSVYPASSYYGLPLVEQLNIVNPTPFSNSTLDAYSYRDLTTLYSTNASTFSNMFASSATQSGVYADLFSQASFNTSTYSNIFGVSLNTGQGYYRDPLYSTGGQYINYSSPISGLSFDQAYSQTPFSGTSHYSGEFSTPWTYIGTSIDSVTAQGLVPTIMGVLPSSSTGTSIQHAAFGIPTAYNLAGFNPSVAGQLALSQFGTEAAAMNSILADQYMFTKEGMPYIANAAYFNPSSYGGSNYYFPSDISSVETGVDTVGGTITGQYVVGTEISGAIPSYGTWAGASGTAASTGYTGLSGGTSAATYGGWSGAASAGLGATSAPAGWGTTSASAGWGTTSGAAFTGGSSFTGGGSFSTGGATYGGTNI